MNIAPQDDLLNRLKSTTIPAEKITIYKNLVDFYYEQPQEIYYLQLLRKETEKTKDKTEIAEALGLLAHAYLKKDDTDSVCYYIKTIQKLYPNENAVLWNNYMLMRLFNYYTFQTENQDEVKGNFEELENNENDDKHVSVQIKNAFILGISLYMQGKYTESIPKFISAVNLANTLPLPEGFNTQIFVTRYLAKAYVRVGKNNQAVELLENLLEKENKHFKRYYADRPFYPVDSYYSTDYTTLMLNVSFMSPEKQEKYMKEIILLCRSNNNLTNKYNYYLSMHNYYRYKKDYKKSLVTNDSLIDIAQVIAPYNLASLNKTNSTLYTSLGDYKNALLALQTSYRIKDSLDTSRMQDELNDLQTKYGVDKLEYEKAQLENRNKQIFAISMGFLLCIAIVLCIYLYRNLRKEKRMKIKMHNLKLKAEESENMKTAFINSVCHEIRTPLNSIVGFTDLLLNESIDKELRETFPQEIQRNTHLLTSLISSMLEVADLDISDAPLSCEPFDINHMLDDEMERISRKDTIEYHLDLPQEKILVSSNERYLKLVIENLLENATKFTESGTIILHCHVVSHKQLLHISVTDTGCGIPEDKRQEVFERFIKLDTYKQGNGLGLYLCALIVKRLSGKIFVDPDYKEGARFVIEVPA